MIVGAFLTFFGKRFLKLLIACAGCLAGGFFGLTTAPLVVEKACIYFNYPQVYYWHTVWGIAGLLGLIGGTLAYNAWKLGVYLAGALGGFTLGSWMLVVAPHGAVERIMPRNSFLAIFALFGMLLTILIENYILMISSVMAGSTMIMFGLDKFCRIGFAEAIEELVNLDQTTLDNVSPLAKSMVAGTLSIALIGLIVQCSAHNNTDKNKK